MAGAASRARQLVRAHGRSAVGFLLLFTFFRMAPLRGWDDAFYVAQLTSAVGDRDLMLQDDLLALPNPDPLRLQTLTTVVEGGALHNTFSVGPALFNAAYTWPMLAGRVWPDLELLRALLALGSMAALVALVVVTANLAERFGTPPALAHVAALLAVAGGPLAVYGTRAYLLSHLLGALWFAVLLRVLLAWIAEPRVRFGAALGLAAGLLVVTRWQDAVLAAALAPAALAGLWSDRERLRARAASLALAAGAAAAVFSVQALAWRAQFGSWLLIPQGGAYVDWGRPQLAAFLFSTYHGFVPWAPAMALGLLCLGLVRAPGPPAARRALVPGLALGVAATVYVSACVADWWGGESAYGARRLAVLTPIAALGLGALLARLPRPARGALVLAVAVWSTVTVTALVSGYDDLRVAAGSPPDAWSPVRPEAYASARWIDRPWTWPRLLRPGFSFSDLPDSRDRLAGAAATLLVFAGTLLLLDRLRRSARAQRLLVGAAGAWVLTAVAWTASLRADPAWNSTWAEIVAGAPPPGRVEVLPEGVAAAAWFVEAARRVPPR